MSDRVIAEMYVRLIRAGKRTIESLPKNLPEGVWIEIEKILNEQPLAKVSSDDSAQTEITENGVE